jgi:hypothetical protein
MAGQSPLTRKLVADGCSPRPKLDDTLALIERLEAAASPGASNASRRRVCLEAARFLRERTSIQQTERAA